MTQLNVTDLVKKAEQNYLKRVAKKDWFKENPRPFNPALRAYSKLNIFKASNVEFNPNTGVATSYNWWKFVDRIGGLVVFNSYYYSPSTSRHQSKVSSLLSQLGIKVDVSFEAPKGLQNLEAAVTHYESKISALIIAIQKPGTRAEKNKERAKEVKSHLETIKTIKSLIRKQK
jgi:hypothetical protein